MYILCILYTYYTLVWYTCISKCFLSFIFPLISPYFPLNIYRSIGRQAMYCAEPHYTQGILYNYNYIPLCAFIYGLSYASYTHSRTTPHTHTVNIRCITDLTCT